MKALVSPPRDPRPSDRGQVLPLFALFLLFIFVPMAALAIDVSRDYALRRYERSAADAASLAGAQDLQAMGSRTVNPSDRRQARTHALQVLVNRLDTDLGVSGGSGGPGACDDNLGNDIIDCALPGTPYHVSISTPSPSCSSCDPFRSVQVTVRNPTFDTTFARVLGQTTWDVGETSVAGLTFGKSYTVITLRPPVRLGSTYDVKDIRLDGGTIVNVFNGDVGSNSNMDYAGVASGTILNIDSGYGMYYFDPFNPPMWAPAAPKPPGQVVQNLTALITDPGYVAPSMANPAPTFDDARTSKWATLPAVDRADNPDGICAAEANKVDKTRYTFMASQSPTTIYCFEPGIYQSGTGAKNATITVGTGEVGLLKPGAYYLKSGLDVGGRIIGGYEAGKPGVALMFDEAGPGNCSSCIFNGNNATTIALNAGTKFPPGTSGTAATAAVDWSGNLVQTSGPDSPTPPLLITLYVKPDPNCFVPTGSILEPPGCPDSKNKTINIAGGGSLALEGVQYMPSDNVEIHGGSAGYGQVGQIISWTLFYSGGTHINQQGPGTVGNGIVRLDAACSAPGEPCAIP